MVGASYSIMDEMTPLYSMMSARPFLEPGLDHTTVVLLATGLIEKFLRMSLISLFRSDAVSKNMISDVFEGKGPLMSDSSGLSRSSSDLVAIRAAS
jgi:hypothetical protein